MLEVNDLYVSYGAVNAVRGISMSASAGRITLVLGPNGAGKTTSLRAVSGLLKARSGSVRLNGKEVLGQSAHRLVRQGMVMVPEGRRIFPSLTVEENLRMGAYAVSRSDAQHVVTGIYEKFPILLERKGMPGGLLSGGEQQMLAFGRAMMSQPQVVLLDEPSMGLAPGMVDRVMTRVREIADTGIAVLMVEQNADAALAVADDVVLVQRGEVVWTGSAAEAQADTALVHTFLGEAALGA
jgi:branched-chain amino acid transport system ATP-binding protein